MKDLEWPEIEINIAGKTYLVPDFEIYKPLKNKTMVKTKAELIEENEQLKTLLNRERELNYSLKKDLQEDTKKIESDKRSVDALLRISENLSIKLLKDDKNY